MYAFYWWDSFHIQFDFSGISSTCSSKYSSSMTTTDIFLHISGYFSILGGQVCSTSCRAPSVRPSIGLFTSEFFILVTAVG